ncbi:MAG TPA: toast rack family protein [Candidatus Sulfopaludibacter sp.]|nr:toast rack family protein [Candidatus Sulfopaludibacter sp.]
MAVAALSLTGCVIQQEASGPTQYDSRSFPKDDAKAVNVQLTMGAGQLKVGSGTGKLMQAYFTYNVPAWKPEAHYTAGKLTVEQPNTHGAHFGSQKYEWDLRFAQDVPLDFNVNFGAGEAQLDLGGLMLQNVEVQMGVGQLKLDLRGVPKHDYRVNINGGVGDATVRLPSDVGVYAEASGGIGSINVRGMTKKGDHWETDAFNQPGVKIHVNVNGGIGQITLIAE